METKNKSINTILSIGGGVLEIVKSYETYPQANLTFIDASKNMIEKVNEILIDNNIEDYVNSICSPFEMYETNEKFNLSLSLLVIHFIENKEQFLTKIYNLLEENGICILSAFSNYHLDWWETFAIHNGANIEQVSNTRHHPENTMALTTALNIEEMAKKTGFKKVEKIAHILSIDLWILTK
ncbi:MAG: class I SAM-dependent methyltransferase [Coprobacillaceae bacterium]